MGSGGRASCLFFARTSGVNDERIASSTLAGRHKYCPSFLAHAADSELCLKLLKPRVFTVNKGVGEAVMKFFNLKIN